MNGFWSNISEYLPDLGAINSKLQFGSTSSHIMSTQDRRAHLIRPTRGKRRVLDVDLNDAPPSENIDQEGTSSRIVSQDFPPAQRGASVTPAAPIDIEALDDDVIISSPRAFAAAKNNSTRTRPQVIVVDDSEDSLPRTSSISLNKRRRVSTNKSAVIGDVYINLEVNSSLKAVTAQSVVPPKPKEPIFNCPVCMGPLVEEVSTKCGHIFCKACIKASITAQGKCPTCRRKIAMKDTIRVYLPATS